MTVDPTTTAGPAAQAQAGGAHAQVPQQAAGGAPDPGAGAGADAPKRVNDAGGDVIANAARPRQASDVNQLLREAGAVFGGDNVGGDKYVFKAVAASAAAVAMRIGQDRIALARAAFAKEPNYTDLMTRCRGRRLLILQAPRGAGKSATALRLLLDLQHQHIFGYHPDTALEQAGDALEAGAGHLVEDMPDARCRGISALTLHDLEAKLGKANATLIVTVSDAVVFAEPDVRRYVLPLGPLPTHRSILELHLRHLLGAAAADDLLRRAELIRVFEDQVPAGTSRARVAEFAQLVYEFTSRGGRQFNIDMLRDRMKSTFTSEVEGWFANLDGLPLKCLAIALALLDGLPYQTVVDTAHSLQRRLDPPPPPGSLNPPPRPDVFGDSRAARIQRLRAHVGAAETTTRVGTAPAEIARYFDLAYPRTVLFLVWREYDAVREQLLQWLGDLANHPERAVRVRAATAVGLISRGAFDYLYHTVLRPWAVSNSERKREMAAYALMEPGRTPALQQQVFALVDEWARGTSWQLQATAARVYGSALGTVSIERTLEELDRLAALDNADVAVAIGYSLAELIDADETLARRVLDRVLAWMADRRRMRNATGQVAFLTIAADLITPNRGGKPDWPLLLSLAVADRGLRHAVATAWQETLNGSLLHGHARTIAGIWAEFVEPDPTGRAALAGLLATTAAGSDRTRRIVRDLAREWTSTTSIVHAPQTAQAVLAAVA